MSQARRRAASAKHAANITKRGDESISAKAKREKAEKAADMPQWMVAVIVSVVLGGVVFSLFR